MAKKKNAGDEKVAVLAFKAVDGIPKGHVGEVTAKRADALMAAGWAALYEAPPEAKDEAAEDNDTADDDTGDVPPEGTPTDGE